MKSSKRDPPVAQYRENIGKHNEKVLKQERTATKKEFDSKTDRNLNLQSLGRLTVTLFVVVLLIGLVFIINNLFPDLKKQLFR